MNPNLAKLIDLHTLDAQAVELKTQLNRIPKQIQDGRDKLEGEKKDLNEANAALDVLIKKRKELEQHVVVENDHMAKVKTKLPDVKTNKEYSAILAEVAGVQKKISAWEDEELEIMQASDDKEKEIPGLKKIFQDDEAEFNIYKAKKETEQARIEKELSALNAQKKELLQSIEPKLAKRYEKLIQYHGDSAVVALEGDACLGCHQLVLPQTAVEVRKGETIFECNHCNRILYAQPEPEPQGSAETVAPK